MKDNIEKSKRATTEDSPSVLTKPEKTTGICDFLDISMYNEIYDYDKENN